jgi:hypothetical protein
MKGLLAMRSRIQQVAPSEMHFGEQRFLIILNCQLGYDGQIPTDEDLFMKYWEGMRSEDHSVIPDEYEQSFGESTTAGDRTELFVSDRGYMGSAPMKLLHGDEIYIFYGCRVPMVLRPYSL